MRTANRPKDTRFQKAGKNWLRYYNIAFENHDEAEKRNIECGYTEICMDAGDEVFKSRQVDEYNDYADAVWISKY